MTDIAPKKRPSTSRRGIARKDAAVQSPTVTDNAALDGRKRLIQQAMILFADRGFSGVTVRDIAKASNVSVGLITHHFTSKEGLREAVDREFMAQFEEVLLLSPSNGTVTAEDYARWVDDWITRHESDWAITVGYFRRALLDESDWGAEVFARFYAIVQDSVMKMDARGEIRPDVDRLWLPFLLIFLELGTTLLDPYIKRILGRSGFDGELWRRRHRAYLDMVRRGVLINRDE